MIQFIDDDSDNDDNDEESDVNDGDICEKDCDDKMEPVCVNGRRSFSNRCQMQVAICREGIDAKTIKNGRCKDCNSAGNSYSTEHFICKLTQPLTGCSDVEDFVCGTNGITYKNECILQKIACEQNLELEVESYGSCEPQEKNSQSEDEDVKCQIPCPRHLMPVCGSDGQTYNNDCLLKTATCQDKSVVKLHNGACDAEKMEIAGK